MPNQSQDDAPGPTEVARVFERMYPNWQNDQFNEFFEELQSQTRIDEEHLSHPRRVLLSFFDRSEISLRNAEQYAGRLDDNDWLAVFAYFADMDAELHFPSRLNNLDIPLIELKGLLNRSGVSVGDVHFASLDPSELENEFWEFCTEKINSEPKIYQVGENDQKRYISVGALTPVINEAIKELHRNREKILKAYQGLREKGVVITVVDDTADEDNEERLAVQGKFTK
jgi:hypothetical protein